VASHLVGHSAVAAKKRSGTYSSNRSRWPCGQVGMFVVARKELADSCLEDANGFKSRLTRVSVTGFPLPKPKG
jgi:hypothetical protein